MCFLKKILKTPENIYVDVNNRQLLYHKVPLDSRHPSLPMTVRCPCHLLMARRAVAPQNSMVIPGSPWGFHVHYIGALAINTHQLKSNKTCQALTMAHVKVASNLLGSVFMSVQPAGVFETIFGLQFTAGNDSIACTNRIIVHIEAETFSRLYPNLIPMTMSH